ncbi:MAG: UDP-glucose/GDP-mannose dehydrogenase family protein, partial [Brevinematales bacterium]
VGIVSGCCFAEEGNSVICYDVDKEKVRSYSNAKSSIYEPGLEELLGKNISAKRLSFTGDITELVNSSEIIFICVGTPPMEDGTADLSQVESAVRTIAENTPQNSYRIIVEKSTVPVGTHRQLKTITKLYNKGKASFDFVVNSEFLREGSAISDFMHPDRIVIGVETDRARDTMLKLYESFNTKKIIVDPSSAEIIKYASNSFLAMKISYINMIADLCEKTGGDVEKIADGLGFDGRIGRSFLDAGIGYGGSCFPKDVKAFISVMQENLVDCSLIKSIDDYNSIRYKKIISILQDELWILKNKGVAVWGLAFKPETDDIREAPSLKVIRELLDMQVKVSLYDPRAADNFKRFFPESQNVRYAKTPLDALTNCEALVILTEWDEFKHIEPCDIYSALALPIVVDGRNIFQADKMKELEFRYFPIGKGAILRDMRNSK